MSFTDTSRTRIGTQSMPPAVGQFVESQANDLGIGKLVSIESGVCVVDYFESPAHTDRFEVRVPIDTVVARPLESETRVYFQDRDTLKWQVGRILDFQEKEKTYLVRFPNDERRMIHESQLETRWSQPIDDPTDHLALQLNETPFWHQGRSAFIHSVYSQRSACGGMPGLLSSAIDLVEHQVAVVRRVLEDPFQRYLLADEVGLGKTIEAGVLIRQFVLDEYESHKVLVIVPDSLVQQWTGELRHRFQLDDQLGASIHVVGHRDLDAIKRLGGDAGMVVIDEAHHVAACAQSKDPESLTIFRSVVDATSPSERRVLLLSATPVLHNEAAFLAMLHLIDPLLYSLDDMEAFRQRVQHRQAVAELMASLTEDESNFFLGQTLTELSQFFRNDTRFHDIHSSLSILVDREVDEQDSERCHLIRALRTHISETWRLHRRLLRNRRTENTEYLLPGRDGGEKCEWSCTGVETLERLLNEWRLSAAQLLYGDVEPDLTSSIRLLVRVMTEASVCDPQVLCSVASERLAADGKDIDSLILLENESSALRKTPLFEGETELLKQICHVAGQLGDDARLRRLEQLIVNTNRSSEGRVPTFVIFTNYPQTADRVCEFLRSRFGENRVLRHDSESSGWTRFIGNSNGLVLVCDKRAEEGLNFQNRRSVAIHYDLPFSPNRIEQRMGRLDRFGAGRQIPSYALVASDSPIQTEWFRCLNEALQVFDRSIASLQYVIESEFQQVWSDFPDSGADAFSDASVRLGGEDGTVETEFRRVRAQDELDAFERDPVAERDFVEDLLIFDLKTSRFREGIEHWLVERLHFRASGEEGRDDSVVRYQFCRRDDFRPRRGDRDTLMSYSEFLRRYEASVDDLDEVKRPVVAETRLVSFDRQVAQRRQTRLARIGDPLIDATENYIRWDDRGICFAMWRFRPDIRLDVPVAIAFRFDIVAEADHAPLRRLLEDWPEASFSALRRRADMVFPPIIGQLWLDSELEQLTEINHRKVFGEPYRDTPLRGQPHAGQDYNLNPERWMKANEFCDITVWRGLCYSARDKAEELLREQSRMPIAIRESLDRAVSETDLRVEQFESRLARTTGDGAVALHRELQFEHATADVLSTARRNGGFLAA